MREDYHIGSDMVSLGRRKMRAIMVCLVSGSVGQVVIGSDAPRKGDIVTIKLHDENGNIVRETGTVAEVL